MEPVKKLLSYLARDPQRTRSKIRPYVAMKLNQVRFGLFSLKMPPKQFQAGLQNGGGATPYHPDGQSAAGAKHRTPASSAALPATDRTVAEKTGPKGRDWGTGANIALISHFLPRFDRTSSEFRLHQMMEILLANQCRIHYLYCGKTPEDPRYLNSFGGDIRFHYLDVNLETYQKALNETGADYILITNLWRINHVAFLARLVASLKQQRCSSKIIIDTIDFHYKEFIRKYELSEDEQDLALADRFLEVETTLYREADTVLVISENEKIDIRRHIAGVDDIRILPNIHEIREDSQPLAARQHICFVGNFGNRHNVDAVRFFIDSIFPLILAQMPDVKFHVIGNKSEQYKSQFKSRNVKVVGFVKKLEPYLDRYRLFVCPMTYGAGVKGKIGMAAAQGLPVVTTSIGAEGFPVRNGEEFLISDSPSDFARMCIDCLTDSDVWHSLSVKSRRMMAEHFSRQSVAGQLAAIFSQNRRTLAC